MFAKTGSGHEAKRNRAESSKQKSISNFTIHDFTLSNFTIHDFTLSNFTIHAGRGVYQCLVALLALSQGWADFNFGEPLTNIGALLYISCAAVLLAMGADSGATEYIYITMYIYIYISSE